jgi:hypothetical protein
MAGFREFLQTRGGIVVGAVLILIGIIATWWSLRPGEMQSETSGRWFVDTTNNKAFKHTVTVGESYPIVGPSGQKTGYQAETCYWTADGHVKSEPTAVVLNETIGRKGPTFCPDCHRLVVGHNPMAEEGKRPPPTEEEYNKRHSAPAAAPAAEQREDR